MSNPSFHISFDRAIQIAKQCTIKDQATSKTIPFILNEEQKEVLKSFIDNSSTMVLKGRQCGISTVAVFYISYLALSFDNLCLGIVCDDSAKATSLQKRAVDFIRGIQRIFGKDLIVTENSKQVELSNGSKIISLTANKSQGDDSTAGRSYSFDVIHFSEMAFYRDGEALYAAVTSSSTSSAKIIIESTSAGKDNFFYDLWTKPISKDFKKIFLSIETHHNYQRLPSDISDADWESAANEFHFTKRECAAWWLYKLNNVFLGDKQRCLREYPITAEQAFTASSMRWITVEPAVIPVITKHPDFFIYKNPDSFVSGQMCPYVMSIDPSGGTGGDNAIAVIIDRRTQEIAACYADNKTSMFDFIDKAFELKNMFSVPFVICEKNGLGHGWIEALNRKGVITENINTTEATKYSGLLLAKHAVETGILKGPALLATECNSLYVEYKTDSERFCGQKDLLMAIGFCLRYMQSNPYKLVIPTNTLSLVEKTINKITRGRK